MVRLAPDMLLIIVAERRASPAAPGSQRE